MEIQASFDPGCDFASLLRMTSDLQDQNERNPSLFSLSPLSLIADDDSQDIIEDLSLPPPLATNSNSHLQGDEKLDPLIFSLSPMSTISDLPEAGNDHLLHSSPPPTIATKHYISNSTHRDTPVYTSVLETPTARKETEGSNDTDAKKKRKRKNKEHSRAARKRRKEEKKASQKFGEYEVCEDILKRIVDNAEPIPCPFDLSSSNVTKAAFIGKDDRSRTKDVHTIEEITEGLGFMLQKWDGKTPAPIIDQRRRFVGLLAGHPASDNWKELHNKAAKAMESTRLRCVPPKPKPNKPSNQRGDFVSLTCGISHGGGQERPGNLCPDGSKKNGPNAQALSELRQVPIFKRLTGFVSSAITMWAPDLHTHYAEALQQLHDAHPELDRPFDNSILSVFAYNLGPQTICYKHKDFGNLPYGMCAITAFGDYDLTRGGHLILWECRLVIEFPPGSTILIASAVITHSNTSILEHELRYSFAQYTAGGIFRWVEHRLKSSEMYYQSVGSKNLDQVLEKEAQRWIHRLSLLPIIAEKNVV